MALLLLAACGKKSVPFQLVSLNPASGAEISPNALIQLTFNMEVAQGSVVLSGELGNLAAFTVSAASLEITPASTWPLGAGKKLTVQVKNQSGAQLDLSATYEVKAGLGLTAQVSPASGSAIGGQQALAITFSSAVDKAAVQLSGALGAASGGPAWSGGDRVLTLTPSTAWPGGAGQTLNVKASAVGGAPSNFAFTYDVDVTGPAVSAILPPTGSAVKSNRVFNLTFDESVAAATLVLGGTLGGEAGPPAWSANNTVLALAPAGSWGEGAGRTLTIAVKDPLGNQGNGSFTYDVDNTAPQLSQIDPPDQSLITGNRQINVTFNERVKNSTLSLGGTLGGEVGAPAWSANDTVLTLSPTAASWGEGQGRQLTIQVSDGAGNQSTLYSYSYEVDARAPAVSQIEPTDQGALHGTRVINVTFNEAVKTSSLVLGGTLSSEAGTPAWSAGNTVLAIAPAASWSEGTGRTLTIAVSDPAGNVGNASYAYRVDTQSPSISQLDPPTPSLIGGAKVISVTFNESVDPSSLKLAGTLGTMVPGWSNDNKVLFIIPATSWSDGNGRTLSIQVSDLAGNRSQQYDYTYNVDAKAPEVESVMPGKVLPPWGTITVKFSEALVQNSLQLGGDIGAAAVSLWEDSKTVVLKPVSQWNRGDGKTLTLIGKDAIGNDFTGGSHEHKLDVHFYVTAHNSADDVGRHNSLALSADGQKVYISYLDDTNDQLRFIRSDDGGRTWNASLLVTDKSCTGRTSLALSGSSVFVGFHGNSGLNGYPDLMFARSDDHGATWPVVKVVNEGSRPGSFAGYLGQANSLAVLGDSVYAVCHEYWCYSGVCDYNARFSRSDDRGATWLAENQKNAGCFTLRSAHSSGLAVRKTTAGAITVYLAGYEMGNSTAIRQLMFNRSDDNGASWGTCVTADNPAQYVGAHSSLAVVGSGDASTKVYVAYSDGTNQDLKFARSDDNGATWPVIKVVDGSTSQVGEYPSLATSQDGSKVYISYRDYGNKDLKFAKSSDMGATWTSQTLDKHSDVGVYTSLAIAGSGATTVVGISYFDLDTKNLKYTRSTDDGNTW